MNALTHDLRTAAANAGRQTRPEAPMRLRRSRLATALHALLSWWRERREVARLSAFPDAMLKDIGVSRGGIPWAVRDGQKDIREHGTLAVRPSRLR
jgi:uncharacterized protein YjiS (DUF1127 family)